jgi:BirA family biotin operon repressor/biotin-[acetyl-CoA-carboxylase] ligase
MPALDEEAVRRALHSAGLPEAGARFEDVTESTNATALALARAGAPEWTVVAAGHQTAGRGRLGRTWESRPGEALLFSVVLRPGVSPDRAVLLTLLAGAAMARAAHDEGASEVRCKWPNDLLVGEAKVGGILAEAAVAGGAVDHLVVGVGVNLGAAPEGVEGAGGLGGLAAEPVLSSFLRRFRAGYGDGGDAPGVVVDYRPLCATIGRRVRATTTDGRTVEGVAVDVDETGALVVDTEGGRTAVGFGEVLHLR